MQGSTSLWYAFLSMNIQTQKLPNAKKGTNYMVLNCTLTVHRCTETKKHLPNTFTVVMLFFTRADILLLIS